MTLELYLSGSDAALFHTVREQSDRPDVLQLGDGTVWYFYRYRRGKVPGNIGCQYKLARVHHLIQITAERVGK